MSNVTIERGGSTAIASWEAPSNQRSRAQEWTSENPVFTRSIASESIDVAWRPLFNTLRDLYESIPCEGEDSWPPPSPATIEAGLKLLKYLRVSHTKLRPNLIVRDPDGGLVIEHRSNVDGHDIVLSFSLLNDGTADCTGFVDGRVVETFDISSNASQ